MIKSFSYSVCSTPEGYVCSKCGAAGVRLYREYSTFANSVHLKCRTCTVKDTSQEPDIVSEHAIGWMVAAVPTEDGETYWGYTSVPRLGVEWWNNLPKV